MLPSNVLFPEAFSTWAWSKMVTNGHVIDAATAPEAISNKRVINNGTFALLLGGEI